MGTVCELCGDIGFEEALVDCDSCQIGTIHRYCLNIVPVPIDDYITWFCANCVGSDNDSDDEQVTQILENPEIPKSINHTNVEPVTASSSTAKETRKEPEGRRQVSGSGNLHAITKGAGSSNSPSVPEDFVSSTSNKPILSSGKCDEEADSFKPTTPYTLRTGDVVKCSRSEGESNMVQTLAATQFISLALDQCGARPKLTPIWRGSITLKKGNIRSIDGLVAHLSILACPRVHGIASSLHTRLSAEMCPRLEIWPKSFLKNGGPKDESIALYFFPSRGSNENEPEFEQAEGRVVDPQQTDDQKNFDSVVLEMKKNDFAMRCILDDAELLLFTSYMLPMHYWSLRSKEYLWGVFRAKQTDQQ